MDEYTKKKVITNFDRIKAMNIEEMARFIDECTLCELSHCQNCIFRNYECNQFGFTDWLLCEVEE